MSSEYDSKMTPNLKKPRKTPILPNEIKCVLLQGYGSVRQMKAISIPRPIPSDGEVLIRVKSCGVNFLDLSIRQGLFSDLPKLPFVPGFECSGEIVQLGPNTPGFQIGERVICLPRFYAWSEYLVINCNQIYKIPDSMSYREAAALSYSYLTAYILLFEIGSIKIGQTVLFHSAGGGVGIALSQLSKLVPNIRTIATCSKSKFEILKNQVDFLLEENSDYVSEAKKICPEGVDLVLDCLSGDNTNKGISITKPLGKYIIYGTSKNLDGESKNYFALAKNWWHVDKISPIKLYEENRSLSGFNLHNFLFNQMFSSRRYIQDIFSKLFNLYRDGHIRPVIDSIHSFDDISLALARLQERKNIGKVIIEPYIDEENLTKDGQENINSSDTDGPDEPDCQDD
ncbi:unnamed protein product [Brachionus calyciflorus]|uniref:Enoyl reductase (ER) domain-containing protein n=1 Tax=Brachionus calyciflorus TaxID=104777 RepID=A0A813M3V9_9BILA|nr:unnamed protein product [Brachionus calyciflorus]